MSLPKIDLRGRTASVSMMELRQAPGEVIDCVARGMTIHLNKNGKRVGTIVPKDADADSAVINSDGSISGQVPLTFRRNLGNGGYGE